jgi:hypothetical protein
MFLLTRLLYKTKNHSKKVSEENIAGFSLENPSDIKFYDLHQDIWDRSVKDKKERRNRRKKEKLMKKNKIEQDNLVLEIYDLHHDIWRRCLEDEEKMKKKQEKQEKKIKNIINLYDIHQDIWSRSMEFKRNERYNQENSDINQNINTPPKKKPISPSNNIKKKIVTNSIIFNNDS